MEQAFSPAFLWGTLNVVVIGGGITGLSAAYYLTRAGVPVTIIDNGPVLGGVMQTAHPHGCTLELGPDSFLSAKPWALDLIRGLGLASGIMSSNDHLRRTYILKNGRLVPMPDGLMMVVPTKVMPMLGSPLLSWRTKARMALEWFRRPHDAGADRSVADFLREHYGQEALDYLGEPLLAGVYGGSPEQLSVQSVLPRFAEMEAKYGSLTRGVLAMRKSAARRESGPLFQTLTGGLSDITTAVVAAAGDRLKAITCSAESIEPLADGWRVRILGDWMHADHLVLAGRAWQSAELLRPVHSEMASLLESIPYASSMTLALGYRRQDVHHPLNGFGFLVPRRERQLLLACTWLGTKFAHRVPDDMAVLRCFLSGDACARSDGEIVAAARAEIRRIMNVDAEPVFTRSARWPRSMAQYSVGHAARVERIEQLAAGIPGLQLAGNAFHGIGVPDCVHSGRLAAERILAAQ